MDEAATNSQPVGSVQPGRRRLLYSIAGILVLLIFAGAAAGPIMSRVEQTEYRIEATNGSIEVRFYEPMIAAEAVIAGERKAAINEGFRLIAAYIFGANKPNARIAMTAPCATAEANHFDDCAGHAAEHRRCLDRALHHAEILDDGDTAGTQ
jgi:hypothetical protein